MDIKHHTHPDQLERYSFMWSEARLVIAAVALFIGGVPPVLAFNPFPALYSSLSSLLQLAWLISGAASVYLFYRWNKAGKRLFGHKESRDKYAFLISIVSGVNLGLVGLLGTNVGMSISSSSVMFMVTGFLYLLSAGYLWKRWNRSGQRVF